MEVLCTTYQCMLDKKTITELREGEEKSFYTWKPANFTEFWGKTLEEGINGKLGADKPDMPAALKVWYIVSHDYTNIQPFSLSMSDPSHVRSPVLLLPLHPAKYIQLRDCLARLDQPSDRPGLVLLLLGSVCSWCCWGQDQHRAGECSGPQYSGTAVL
jgi:hypothetical protein